MSAQGDVRGQERITEAVRLSAGNGVERVKPAATMMRRASICPRS